eukprot:7169690-Prymnesium_polylepis.1
MEVSGTPASRTPKAPNRRRATSALCSRASVKTACGVQEERAGTGQGGQCSGSLIPGKARALKGMVREARAPCHARGRGLGPPGSHAREV